MRNLLVTGGAGFIGSHFTEYWLASHSQDRVVVLDALTYAGDRSHLQACEGNARFRFVQGDIADHELLAGLLREEAIDTLVNFAAESHVDRRTRSWPPTSSAHMPCSLPRNRCG